MKMWALCCGFCRWQEALTIYPRTNKHNLKKKRKVEPPTPQVIPHLLCPSPGDSLTSTPQVKHLTPSTTRFEPNTLALHVIAWPLQSPGDSLKPSIFRLYPGPFYLQVIVWHLFFQVISWPLLSPGYILTPSVSRWKPDPIYLQVIVYSYVAMPNLLSFCPPTVQPALHPHQTTHVFLSTNVTHN